jgi:uncharacterized protein YgbK (DUF1537 family)
MKPLLGIIADDLTGGMESASMLVSLGIDCGFVTKPDRVAEVAGSQAIVVAQKTRVCVAAEAVEKSRDAARHLLDAGARQLFFKYCATFDSTDEGNIGPVADALLEMTGADCTAFVPTSAELWRSVFNGYLFYGRPLVSESPKRFDPLTPMTDPDLVRVLQRQSREKVGLIEHKFVRGDAKALAKHVEALKAQGYRHFIADAVYLEDLAAIAALTVDWKLMTGNSPILQHLAPIWRVRGWLGEQTAPIALPAVGGAGVVLAGSVADRTLEQLAAFERERPVLRIDLATAESVERTVGGALQWAGSHLGSGPVAIATSATPDQVAIVQARLGKDGAARFAEEVLSTLAVELHARGARRFMVAGGETSGAIVERLGIEKLRIGTYQGPGIARATSEGNDPVALSLKSGKLGPAEMFLPTLEAMARV